MPDVRDLERIARYAFDYGRGGWETRLLAIGPRGVFYECAANATEGTTRIVEPFGRRDREGPDDSDAH